MKHNPKHRLLRTWLIYFSVLFFAGAVQSRAQDTLLYPSLAPGSKAPPVSGTDEHGNPFRLSKIKSRYTLLYFYEVHCHLCEVVTPELKKLYDFYHPLGLEVIAVAIESDKEAWTRYIEDQSLTWKNIYPGDKNRDHIKSNYLLTVSPTIYLLDRNKILLTQRLGRAEQVEEELNQRIR